MSLNPEGSARVARKRRKYRGPWPTDEAATAEGDSIGLAVGDLNSRGEMWSEHEGFPVLVEGGIPGELVEAEVIRRYPEHFAALVTRVLEPSRDRVDPPCPYFGPCTGCQWQHVRYERQLRFKREMVEKTLSGSPALAAVEVKRALASPETLGYRNHARFTVGRREGEVGYVNAITRRFLRVDHCLLMHDSINEVLTGTQTRLKGMTQFSVRVGINTGDRIIQPALPEGIEEFPSGQKRLRESLCGREFRVAGSSFFQVNTRQAERMAGLVRERLDLKGDETLVDAYAGVGVFAVLMAHSAGRVIAIEDSPSAVEDARANAEGLDNVEFVLGRTEDVLGQIQGPVDAVILDPPRAGCHPEVIDAVKRQAPVRVVLISCDLTALQRDLERLCEGGEFTMDHVQPVDMFPQTRHIENVSLLRRSG